MRSGIMEYEEFKDSLGESHFHFRSYLVYHLQFVPTQGLPVWSLDYDGQD